MTATEVTTAAYYTIVHRASGQHLFDAWYDQDFGGWHLDFDHDYAGTGHEVMHFATRDAALDAFKAYRADPRKCALMLHPEVRKCTAEGRADVAARRAARNADRKW